MSKPSDLFLAAYFVAYLRASSAEAKAIVWDDNYFPMSYLILFGSIRIAKSRTGLTRWNLFAHDYLKKLCSPYLIQEKNLSIPIRFR